MGALDDHPTIDPAIGGVLDAMAQIGGPPLDSLSPTEARQLFALLAAGDPAAAAPAEDVVVAGPGGPLRVRIHRPADAADRAGTTGGLVWFHGGGWVVGDLATAAGTAAALAERSGVTVVSVDYRLAPEHRFPAAVDDALAALAWVVDRGPDLGIDPSRLAVGGDSAGGNLAAVLAIAVRDAGGPPLRHQLLVYPVTDLGREHASYVENGDGLFLTAATMRWFAAHYLADADPTDPRCSPLRIADLTGVAPAHVVTAALDPLRDEGDAYAAALTAAGVAVDHDTNPSLIHGFLAFTALSPAADAAVGRMATRLARALG